MNEGATNCRGEQSSPLSSPTEDEILVAQILLDLPYIIREKESRLGFKWGSKGRRSRLDEGPSSSEMAAGEIPQRKPKAKAEEAAAAASPVTPLCFAPSESDDRKSRRAFNKSCRKKSKEEYSDLIEELTQRRDLLRGEIENVTKYYKKLSAYNSELKAMKQEVLNSGLRIEKSEIEISPEMNLGVESTQNHHHLNRVAAHQQPLTDRTAEKFQHSSGPDPAQLHSPYNGLGSVHLAGPRGIPDLNISAVEAFGVEQSGPSDASRAFADRRARFAEARRMRKGIIKIKSMRRACGITLPETR